MRARATRAEFPVFTAAAERFRSVVVCSGRGWGFAADADAEDRGLELTAPSGSGIKLSCEMSQITCALSIVAFCYVFQGIMGVEANKPRPGLWQRRGSPGWDDGTASIGWFKRAGKVPPHRDVTSDDDAPAEKRSDWDADYGSMGWVHGKRSMSEESLMRMFNKFRKP